MEVKYLESNLPRFSKTISLVVFIPREAPEDLWEAYFTLSETVFREFNKKGRLPDRGVVRRFLSTPNPLYSVKRWMAFDEEERGIAFASISYDTELSPDYESNKHVCQVRILVAPAYRRKKIATFLLKNILETTRLLERDTVMAEADNLLGLDFCKHLRGELVHEEVQYSLYLEDVDWQLIGQWLQRGRTKSRDTKVEFFRECPEKDIEGFCRTYTEIINQRPTGDMEQELITTPASRRIEERNLKKKGIEWYTMISREHDDRISGLTDIMYNPEEPYRVSQYFTGVLAHYRRRGLAKRLKAEMLVVIKNRFLDVEYITTSTARTNRPMRSINKELGFQPTKTCFIFRWALVDLEQQADEILQGLNRSRKRRIPLPQYAIPAPAPAARKDL
jgi:GNAT superfamily N-acetyltransferase